MVRIQLKKADVLQRYTIVLCVLFFFFDNHHLTLI
jgi:hypothetical protein